MITIGNGPHGIIDGFFDLDAVASLNGAADAIAIRLTDGAEGSLWRPKVYALKIGAARFGQSAGGKNRESESESVRRDLHGLRVRR